MKAKLPIQFLCFVLMIISPLYVYGQNPGGQICSVCRKSNRDCSYKGNHPKCQTCGKIIGARTNKCPHNGKHPICQTCGKLKEQCPYNGKHPKPQPATGTLSITSTPSGANVKIDDKYLGETPLTLEKQNPGSYSVTLSAEGYETQTKSVTVTAGKTATCSATLKKKQASQPVVQQPLQQPTTTTTTSSSQTITANGVSFKMIRVEGGTFTMGATSEQGSDAYYYEKPTHKITLSTYYIGETEVTQALWQAVMGNNPSKFNSENRPAEQVSWDECQEFIRKLNSITGKTFRLPTEAEWEYAARGGNKSQGYTYSGSNVLGNVAWYTDNSNGETSPVRTKSPNELGLYDMSGNVWEWCEDSYSNYKSSSLTNPTGPSHGSNRVYRGGSWYFISNFCRVSYRSFDFPSIRSCDLGLRLAL